MLAPIDRLREQVASLRASNPEIWEDGDDILIEDMLEGSTDIHPIIGMFIKRAELAAKRAEADKLLIQELKVGKATLETKAKQLRKLCLDAMQDAGLKRMSVPGWNLIVTPGQPTVLVTEPMLLPPGCVRVIREPDKVAIKERILDGIEVPGATLSNADDYLQVRVAK